MSEENSANNQEQATAPIFRLQKMYIKDLSFENPNAPDVFKVQQSNPKVDVNLTLKNKKVDDDHYEVVLSMTAKVTNSADNKTLFIAEIEHGAVFMLKHIPEEHMQMVLAVECPNMLFPFTRQILSQLTVDGGFVPFLMEPVNFMALYQNTQQKNQQQEQQSQQ